MDRINDLKTAIKENSAPWYISLLLQNTKIESIERHNFFAENFFFLIKNPFVLQLFVDRYNMEHRTFHIGLQIVLFYRTMIKRRRVCHRIEAKLTKPDVSMVEVAVEIIDHLMHVVEEAAQPFINKGYIYIAFYLINFGILY